MRGLKLILDSSGSLHVESHPTWVRGLKHAGSSNCCWRYKVAPYVGAWIETFNTSISNEANRVAPYVGAWIETQIYCNLIVRTFVAPYVGAWIETLLKAQRWCTILVAPYVGAWIETTFLLSPSNSLKSRTLRGCVD